MPHKIEITDRTYEKLKEYCSLNDLKIGQYADKLIFDGLMIEMYGDVPFTDYRKKIVKEFPVEQFEKEYMQQPVPITDDETDDAKEEEVKPIEAPPIPEEIIERKKALDKEFLENAGVPEKVIRKINKRRLK
jgi:hypothetical protein